MSVTPSLVCAQTTIGNCTTCAIGASATSGSNARSTVRCGLIAIGPAWPKNSVLPSGTALITSIAATSPPAPGL
jgi:hypothetical protein